MSISRQEEIEVLHVDDEPEFAELTQTFLERTDERFEVRTATSAEDGLAAITDNPPDCVVSDYDMPSMDGLELLGAVREEYPELPYILYTGKGSETVASEAISAGVTDYLQKGSGTEQYELLANRIQNAVAAHTAAQNAAERLHELEQILKTVPTAVTRVDEDGNIVFANERVKQNLGLEPDEITDRTYNDPRWEIADLDGDPIPDENLPFQQVFDTGEPIEGFRHNLVWPDGTRRTVEVNAAPIFDDGDVESVVCSVADITDRIERIQELRTHEKFLEYSPDLIVVLTEEGTIKYQSPTPEDVLNFEPQTVLGDSPDTYIHPDDQQRVQSDFERVLASEPSETIRTEFRYKSGDGEYRWLENRATNYLDQEPVNGILVATRDITERKEIEESLADYASTITQLQESAQRLLETTDTQEAAEVAVSGLEEVFEFDLAGLWMANDAGTRLDPTIITDKGQALIADPPTYTESESSLSWEAYQQQEPQLVREMEDREKRHNEGTPIQSELIVPLGEYGVLNIGSTEPAAFSRRDLSRIEAWGNMIESTLARLKKIERLRDREQALQRERDRLDEFASFVSHDLRNPLNVAQLRLGLVQQRYDDDDLDSISSALDRMETLIGDLLTLARQGATVSDTETVQLPALLSDCWKNVESNGAELRIEADGQIQADRNRAKSAVENIFRNAIDHGGDDITVTVGLLPEEDGIYIADDGRGISPEAAESIFESGFSTSDDGTGLGLAIVQQIVDAHDWQISVTESADGGARFDITGIEMTRP